MLKRLKQLTQLGFFLAVIGCLMTLAPRAIAAPYAAMVIDARSGKVLHARNADTRLHPASLTKMMTLYITFEAVKRGELSLDSMITISKKAASEPPSKLGLRAGQKIKLRYLIRGASIKSANDAATALGEAVSGSEAAFARRMNRTAKALGMTRSHFKNAHGLTETGHMSTARDMTTLGRHLFFDHPDYYHLFSRRTADTTVRKVNNTNTRFLNSYRGADGIKTGYTRAAGFNLVASAERGKERIITTVFGGQSTASRNAKVAELMDLGFRRAPTRVAIRKPALPNYAGVNITERSTPQPVAGAVGKTVRLVGAVKKSPRPLMRPISEAETTQLATLTQGIVGAVEEVTRAETQVTPVPVAQTLIAETQVGSNLVPVSSLMPPPRPSAIVLAASAPKAKTVVPQEVVTRVSSSGGRHWGINVGILTTRHKAERLLLKTALKEVDALENALRKVVNRPRGWYANFVGLTKEEAALACRRLEARNDRCTVVGP